MPSGGPLLFGPTFHNGVHGIDAFDREAFPEALIVSDNRCRCATIEDKLTEIEGLVDYMLR